MAIPGRGRADFFAPGDWNVACSMCGRKRKASTLVRNWQGLYRCLEHNEPRQPQDFARGVKDIMTVPFAQLETDIFVNTPFPLPGHITPAVVTLAAGTILLGTELFVVLDTESGVDISLAAGFIGSASVVIPPWIIPESYTWSWFSGGTGININSEGPTAIFEEATTGHSGVAQVVVTTILGSLPEISQGPTGTFFVQVNG